MKKKTILSIFTAISLMICSVLFLSGTVHAEEEMPDNGIPVVYLNIDESQGTIQDMITSDRHTAYCYGSVSIDVPEGFHYSDFPDLPCESVENLAMSIRGRGNSTWVRSDKKPFKIKLDKKTDLFGLGKNKHWVLVANALDESLLRDRITAWLGDELGFEFTPRGVPVDVVISGETYGTKYLGSYYLSENVRVDTNRLEIDELTVDDVDESTITGGYLVQNGLQVDAWSPDRFLTSRSVLWATHTPSFDPEDSLAEEESTEEQLLEESFAGAELGDGYVNHVQQQYIQNHIQLIEDTLYEGGTAYHKLMDLESAAKYWLINDFSKNADAYGTGSTYIYKKRDVDGVVGKLYWGPLWDFDFAWNNRPYTDGFSCEHVWLYPMFCDRGEGGFVEEVRKQWPAVRAAVVKLIEDGGVIDKYCEETKASAARDRVINPDSADSESYTAAVENLKTWIKDRLAWVDEHFDEIDNLAHVVTFMVDGEEYAKTYYPDGGRFSLADYELPKREGMIFLGWYDEEGNKAEEEFTLKKELTLTAKFISEDEATYAEDITFRKDNDIIGYNSHSSSYQIDYSVVPEDAVNKKVEWTSSDESYATVNEEGVIQYNGTGQVTITATLKNGKSRQFTLTVTNDEIPAPETIVPEEETIYMTVGEYAPVIIDTNPSPSRINEYAYQSENPDIASVDVYGFVKALSPGETKVKVKAIHYSSFPQPDIEMEAEVTVIITEKEPAPAPVKMHRLYNPYSGEHFYTANAGEKDALVKLGWQYENVGWIAPETSDTPVYRLYNQYGGEHHYTTNEKEKDALVKAGWTDENIGWYSDDNEGIPVYREYNPNMYSCNHNYTANKGEHDALLKLGWKDEGTAWFGMKSE